MCKARLVVMKLFWHLAQLPVGHGIQCRHQLTDEASYSVSGLELASQNIAFPSNKHCVSRWAAVPLPVVISECNFLSLLCALAYCNCGCSRLHYFTVRLQALDCWCWYVVKRPENSQAIHLND